MTEEIITDPDYAKLSKIESNLYHIEQCGSVDNCHSCLIILRDSRDIVLDMMKSIKAKDK